MKKITLSLIAALSIATAAPTQSIDLGAQASKGKDTSGTSTFSGTYKYDNTFDDIKVGFKAEALSGKSDGIINDEKYSADIITEKLLDNNWLGYLKAGWLKDRIKLSIDSKVTVGFGVGKSIIKNEKRQLDIKLGAASVNTKSYGSDHYNSYIGLEESIDYKCNVRDGVKLYANLNAVEDFSNFSKVYDIKGLVGLEVAISANATMKVEYGKDFFHTENGSTYTDRALVKLGYKF